MCLLDVICTGNWELTTGKIRHGNAGPVAIQTKLGWVLSGPTIVPSHHQPSTCLVTHTLQVDSFSLPEAQSLDDRLKDFWSLESFGVGAAYGPVLNEFNSKICFTEGKYEVSLPWKNLNQVLPSNYQVCLQHLRSLLRRLQRDMKQ